MVSHTVQGRIQALCSITLFESASDKIRFRAMVLKWDESKPGWSVKSSNGVRYNHDKIMETFSTAIKTNGGIPVMYNHVIEGEGADQLGLIDKLTDTTDGLIIEGYLNKSKQRVREEITPGFLKTVSLQVIAEDYWKEKDESGTETIYAKPERVLEVSFVPVNGVVGAQLLELAMAESLKTHKEHTYKQGDIVTLNIAGKNSQGIVMGIEGNTLIVVDENGNDYSVPVEQAVKEDVTTGNSSATIGVKLDQDVIDPTKNQKLIEIFLDRADIKTLRDIFYDK